MKRKIATVLLVPSSLVLLLIAGKVVTRVYHLLRWDITFFAGESRSTQKTRLSTITLDPVLGWQAAENYQYFGKNHNSDQTEYEAIVTQDRNGFRSFGDRSPLKPNVFVIGDSFTQAVEASDDKLYYSYVGRDLDLDVFAYGGGGYGSLQEFMIFDRYFDLVKPDFVIWQYSTNDLINNSPELEAASRINNNGITRPYWVNGQIIYILPKRDTVPIRQFSLKYCRTCYMILNRWDRLRAAMQKTIETDTSIDEYGHPMFLEAVQVTDEIIKKVRERAGSTPIYAFIVGSGEPYGPEYDQALAQISLQHDIRLLKDVESAVLEAERNGTVARAGDGVHWNEVGHRIAGEALVKALQNATH